MKEWLPMDEVMNIWVKIASIYFFLTLWGGVWFLEKYLSLLSFPREISGFTQMFLIELPLLIIFYFPLGYYAWFRKKEIGWIKLYSKIIIIILIILLIGEVLMSGDWMIWNLWNGRGFFLFVFYTPVFYYAWGKEKGTSLTEGKVTESNP